MSRSIRVHRTFSFLTMTNRAELVVSWLISISTPLLTTTSVMLSTVVLVALGYMMQRCEEVGCQNHGNAEVAHSESH